MNRLIFAPDRAVAGRSRRARPAFKVFSALTLSLGLLVFATTSNVIAGVTDKPLVDKEQAGDLGGKGSYCRKNADCKEGLYCAKRSSSEGTCQKR